MTGTELSTISRKEGSIVLSTSRSSGIQYLRALAAVSVVVYHSSAYIRIYRNYHVDTQLFAWIGVFGVSIFFVISGYLMAVLSQTGSASAFLIHRVIRIYPFYWLCIALAILLQYETGTFFDFDPMALLLIPGWRPDYVFGAVEWTLCFELTFYSMISLIMISGLRRATPVLALLWLVVILVMFVARPDLQAGAGPTLPYLPLSLYSIPFAVGLLIPFVSSRYSVGQTIPFIVVGLFLLYHEFSGGARTFLALCFGCVLLVALAVRPSGKSDRGPIPILMVLGNSSYALYLCHIPVIGALCRLAPAAVSSSTLWAASVGLPILVSVALGRIDLLMYRKLKLWVDHERHAVRLVCVTFFSCFVGLGGYAYAHVLKMDQITAPKAVLADRLSAVMLSKHVDLATAATSLGLLQDAEVRAAFNNVGHVAITQTYAQGWAVDTSEQSRSVQVMLFECSQVLGVALPTRKREDVTRALGMTPRPTGFDVSFPSKGICDDHRITGLVATDSGHYAIIALLLPDD